jgi:hypothetical protein
LTHLPFLTLMVIASIIFPPLSTGLSFQATADHFAHWLKPLTWSAEVPMVWLAALPQVLAELSVMQELSPHTPSTRWRWRPWIGVAWLSLLLALNGLCGDFFETRVRLIKSPWGGYNSFWPLW